MRRTWLLPELMLLAAFSLWAGEGEAKSRFWHSGQEGWFFYRERLPEEKKEKKEKKTPPRQGHEGQSLVPFSAAWLKKNLPKFREKAIDDPKPQNVAAYFALQRLAIDKAERFARASALLPMLYPDLDENLRRPIAQYGANLSDQMAREAMEKALSKIAKTCGLFFFFHSACPHCQAQAEVLEALERRYGFKILAVSIDGGALPGGQYPNYRIDSGQAQALGVEVTPALFLVNPQAPEERVRRVGQGAMSLSELTQRIVEAAFQAGWIDKETYERTLPAKPIYLEPAPGTGGEMSPEEVLEALGVKSRGSSSDVNLDLL